MDVDPKPLFSGNPTKRKSSLRNGSPRERTPPGAVSCAACEPQVTARRASTTSVMWDPGTEKGSPGKTRETSVTYGLQLIINTKNSDNLKSEVNGSAATSPGDDVCAQGLGSVCSRSVGFLFPAFHSTFKSFM